MAPDACLALIHAALTEDRLDDAKDDARVLEQGAAA